MGDNVFVCSIVGINNGVLNCVKSDLDIVCKFISAAFCSLSLQFWFNNKDVCDIVDETFSFVTMGVKFTLFSFNFCFNIVFEGVLHKGLLRSIFAYSNLVVFVRLVLKSFNHSWSLLTWEIERALWFADSTEYFLATLYELIADTPSLSNVIFNNCSESFDKPISL